MSVQRRLFREYRHITEVLKISCRHERDWIFAYSCPDLFDGMGFLKISLPFNLVTFLWKIPIHVENYSYRFPLMNCVSMKCSKTIWTCYTCFYSHSIQSHSVHLLSDNNLADAWLIIPKIISVVILSVVHLSKATAGSNKPGMIESRDFPKVHLISKFIILAYHPLFPVRFH